MRYWNAIQRVYVTVRGTNRQFAELADELEKYYDFLEFDEDFSEEYDDWFELPILLNVHFESEEASPRSGYFDEYIEGDIDRASLIEFLELCGIEYDPNSIRFSKLEFEEDY